MALTQITQNKWATDAQRLGRDYKIRFAIYSPSIDKIENGVGLYVNFGWWAISFEDFEEMYLLARQAREGDVS